MESVGNTTGRATSGKLVTQEELAERSGVAVRTVERWRSTGEGPNFVRIGPRKVAYREEAIEAWLSANTFPHRAAELAREVA